jgi:hypothetical protein
VVKAVLMTLVTLVEGGAGDAGDAGGWGCELFDLGLLTTTDTDWLSFIWLVQNMY